MTKYNFKKLQEDILKSINKFEEKNKDFKLREINLIRDSNDELDLEINISNKIVKTEKE